MKFSELEKKTIINLWMNDTRSMADALSAMIGKEVNIGAHYFRNILVNDVPKPLNPEDISFVMAHSKISGGIEGVIATASSLKDILKLVDIMLHKSIGFYK